MFGLSTILVSAALAACTALSLPAHHAQKRGTGVCSSPDFVPVVTVGGSGTAFCESNWGSSYLPITNITVWSDSLSITGIQATYSDGSQGSIHGRQAAYKTSQIGVNYGGNDHWSRVSMYGVDGSGSYVLHLLLEASNGDVINAGESMSSGDPHLTRHDQAVGSGVLYGIQGNVNSDGVVNSLGFLFLNSPIAEIQVTNVTFPSGVIGTSQGINPTTIGSAQFYNNDNVPVQYQFNNQLSETQAYQYTQSYTNTFSTAEAINFSFTLNLMVISFTAGSTTTFTWTTATTTMTSTTFTQAIQVQYNTQITLQPGQSASCDAVAGQGAGRFPYASTVTITLKNGNVYSFPEDGELSVSAISQGQAECSPTS